MPTFDFDFQRYVARRKGAREAQVREGAAYAFSGDVRVLRTAARLRPIVLSVEEAGRLWRSVARAELLGTAQRVGPDRFPEAHRAAARCAEVLHIEPPTVYVAPQPAGHGVLTLGTAEDAYVVLSAGILESLTEAELVDVLGRECGRIQNGHVPFLTALHYLTGSASTFVRWAVRPATLTLQAWSRRAQITADRAGLICSRDLDVSVSALRKSATCVEAPELLRRQRALARFADSQYYRKLLGLEGAGGDSAEACDAAVNQILDSKAEGPKENEVA